VYRKLKNKFINFWLAVGISTVIGSCFWNAGRLSKRCVTSMCACIV